MHTDSLTRPLADQRFRDLLAEAARPRAATRPRARAPRSSLARLLAHRPGSPARGHRPEPAPE